MLRVTSTNSTVLIGMCAFAKRPDFLMSTLDFALLENYDSKGYTTDAPDAVLQWLKKIPK